LLPQRVRSGGRRGGGARAAPETPRGELVKPSAFCNLWVKELAETEWTWRLVRLPCGRQAARLWDACCSSKVKGGGWSQWVQFLKCFA